MPGICFWTMHQRRVPIAAQGPPGPLLLSLRASRRSVSATLCSATLLRSCIPVNCMCADTYAAFSTLKSRSFLLAVLLLFLAALTRYADLLVSR